MNKLKALRRNITLNYGFTLLNSMNLDRGIWMLYLAYSGLSLFEIGIVESFYHISSFMLEVPTGAVADLFSRKLSRTLGRASAAVSVLLMLFANHFWGFMLAFFFTALGGCLESGAGDALVYDSLKELKDEGQFVKIKGTQEMIFHMTGVITLVLGGYLAKIDYQLVYIVGIFFVIGAFFISLGFKEPDFEEAHEQRQFKKQLVESVMVLKNMPKLAIMMIAIEGVASCVTTSFFYMQNYMSSWGLTTLAIGSILATGSIVNGITSWQTNNIEKCFGMKNLLVGIPVVSVILFFGLPYGWLGVCCLVALSSLESVTYVIMSNFINSKVPSAQRATILSFQSMAFSFFMIIVFPIIGKVGDVLGLARTLWITGVVCAILALVIMKNKSILDIDKGVE